MADKLFKGPFDEDMRLVDMQDGTFAERVEAHPPLKFLTDNNGDYARLRVDVGQTGFFAGREARTFYAFSIPTASSTVIKVVSLTDTIVQQFAASLDAAALQLELVVGGTEGGTFNVPLPIIKTNTMSTASAYTPQVTMTAGGTHTGGTIVDILRLKAGSPLPQAVEVTASEDLPNGFAAGTFYIRLVNIDGETATGVFRARWEERP